MLKVFLVEDETVIREGLRDRIPWEQYGYRFVGEAADGEVALPLIRKTRPEVRNADGMVIQFVFVPSRRFNGPTGDKNIRTIPQSTMTEIKFGA